MTMTTEFRPFEVDHSAERWVGTILRVNAVNATIPDSLLPKRVRINKTYTKTATPWLEYFLQHPSGMVSLPRQPGDGGPSLRQLLGWLDRQGYRPAADSSSGFGVPDEYVRD